MNRGFYETGAEFCDKTITEDKRNNEMNTSYSSKINRVIKTTSKELPDPQIPQLPVSFDSGHGSAWSYSPEFWLEIQSDLQQELIEDLVKCDLEYLVYEIMDSVKSMVVCRGCFSYDATSLKVVNLCKKFFIHHFIVSDGNLSIVDVNGFLSGFVTFD